MGEKHLIISDLGGIAAKNRANYVLVKVKADFPTPSGGIITLANDTMYEINGVIALGADRLVLGVNNFISGGNPLTDTISYTGSSPMITGVNKDFVFQKTGLTSTSSKIFDVIGDNTNKFKIEGIIINGGTALGEIKGGFLYQLIQGNLFIGLADGLNYTNDFRDVFIFDNFFDAFTGTATLITINNSATYGTISISRNVFNVVATQTALNIALGLVLDGGALMSENSFEGDGDHLIGINPSTEGWLIPVDANIGVTGLLRLDPFQLIDTTYSTTTDLLGLTTDVFLLSLPENHQELATVFKSGPIDCWVNHDQSGQDIVVCLADNNAPTGDEILGFGFTGKFTITNITYQGSNITRYEFDGKNGETAVDPFDLTRVFVGEMATFDSCTNASNDGTYIIVVVNDSGTKYVDVLNTNRTDGTDDETGSPGESYGGSVCWETIATAGTYQQITIPSVELPSDSDIRAGLRRGSTSGGNPTINIADESDIGGENDGWITPINY